MAEVKDIQDVWGGFTPAELDTMLFSFSTTCNTLLERAKKDKQVHDVYEEGSPGDLYGLEELGATSRHRLQQAILEKQKLFEELQGLIEEASYMADKPYVRKEWELG